MISPPPTVIVSIASAQRLKDIGNNPECDALSRNEMFEIKVDTRNRYYHVCFLEGYVINSFWCNCRSQQRVLFPERYIDFETYLEKAIVSNLNAMIYDVRKARVLL